VRTCEIVSRDPLLVSYNIIESGGSKSYLKKCVSAIQEPLSKTRRLGKELGIFKYALYWMLRFNPWDKIPGISEVLSRITVLQASITSMSMLEDLASKSPRQIEVILNWDKKTDIYHSTLKWLNSIALTAMKLNTWGACGKMPAALYNICLHVYTLTFMILSSRYVKETLKEIQREPLESEKIHRVADSVNSFVLGIFYLFFYSTMPREVLALETADNGLSFAKRNLLQERRSLDKLCAYYLPEKMRAHS
jgi:hypothetical protein